MRYDEPRHVWEGFLSVFITTPVAVFFLSVSERAVSDVQTKTVFISVTRLSRRKPSAGQGGGERPELSEALELDVSVHTLIERAQAVGGGCASHCCHAPAWLEE